MSRKYVVYDTTGNPVGVPFKTIREAEEYKAINRRFDWTVRLVNINIWRESTPKQRGALAFCEDVLDIQFEGNRHDFYEVSDFLSEYLEEAKQTARELSCSYSSYMWNHD